MSPRNKTLCIFVSVFLVIQGAVLCVAWSDNLLIDFFQNHISAVDGDRCSMTPSCSAYAKEALATHGAVIGWIMTCDRLVRCGHDEITRSDIVTIKGVPYAHDPVSENDFWWFDRKIKDEK